MLEPIDINKLIKEVLDEYGLTEEESILIKYKESKINPLINADKFLVKQVKNLWQVSQNQ